MSIVGGVRAGTFLTKAQFAMRTTQKKLGAQLGVSRRTMSRWVSRTTSPTTTDLARLAGLVHPHDAPLATEIARALGETLETLGVVPPAPPPPAAPPAMSERVDLVVYAAAEAMDQSPRALRVALFAAVKRVGELGLSLADVQAALAPPVGRKTKKKAG